MRRRDFIRSAAVAGAATAFDPTDLAARWAFVRQRASGANPRSTRLDTGWRFLRGDPAGAQFRSHGDSEWEQAILPHTARVESLVTGEPGSPTYQWQGVCWYRRTLDIPADAAGKKVFLKLDGAMNVAEVFLDGEPIGTHMGGYLPFLIDITDRIDVPGVIGPPSRHLLAVRLDNRDNPITGPKPLEILDFNMYGGLYRPVHLIVKDRLHITDPTPITRGLRERRPAWPDEPMGGGVFVDYPEVSRERALVRVRTHVRNEYDDLRRFDVRSTLVDASGQIAATDIARDLTLPPGSAIRAEQTLLLDQPRLWTIDDPYLYTLRTEVLAVRATTSGARVDDGTVVDREETRVGIRHIVIDRDGFAINGERLFLRGTNRHQEYPYIGYALPDAAQYRDAWLIKQAGFDYIRLSHYPQSPAFMDACDELGLVVMNCIPGWQYFGEDPEFAELQYRNTRELVRRDRNHPCVILWEVSLNETAMPPEFVQRTHEIAHQEYPGDQMYTCGWTRGYDVFIRARQHGGCHDVGPELQPCLVSEYGDWEYYAMTAGLNQEDFQALTADEQNSRQLRWHGEAAMLQQATNFQEAHDDNRGSVAFADGLWVMFDYNRGYAPDIESSGAADIFRLPKYSVGFFRSQRDANLGVSGPFDSPVVIIASEWTPRSSTRVRVYSNCDEVELFLNGRSVGRQRPDSDRISRHLAHPPFTFDVGRFEPGTLDVRGYIEGREMAMNSVWTPGSEIDYLRMWIDWAGKWPVDTSGKDVLICHASLEANHRVVPEAWENVAFGVTGDARLIGANPFTTDAGIASILVETQPGARSATVYGLALIGDRVLHMRAPVIGDLTETSEVRRTASGAELLVHGEVVARLDAAAPKFRVRGSEASERRDPYRHG